MASYQTKRSWQKEEAALKEAIKPLRNEVSKALKVSGVKASEKYTKRVTGTAYTDGYTIDSDPYKAIIIVKLNGNIDASKIEAALSGFSIKFNGEYYEVSK